MTNDDLIAALAEWATIQDAPERAATLLLLDHGHWLKNRQFVDRCVAVEDDAYWVDWWQVKDALKADVLPGTNSELALLRFALQIAHDTLGMSSLDAVNRRLCIAALAYALGVPQ